MMNTKISHMILFSFIAGILFSCSGDKIADSSKTMQCRDDINGALLAFQREMGLPYQVTSEDYKTIFEKGEIKKEYYRDGIRYSAYFQLSKSNEGCDLVFYKRGKSEPGSYSTRSAHYGNVPMKQCICN